MTTDIDIVDRQILDLLQREFPMASRPFAILSSRVGIAEEEIIERVECLYHKRLIRQISAIFDTKRLGYDSCLIAMQIPSERLDMAAAAISEHPGVSHNYARSHSFNLWFTIATPPGEDLASTVVKLGNQVRASNTLLLPAVRMFKIGVKLDMGGTQDPLSLERGNSIREKPLQDETLPPLTESEIAAIRELQEDLPVEKTPFRGMANRLRITEEELFGLSKRFIRQGRMRRFAAILRHREAGFKANAMGVWIVPPEDKERIGLQLAAFQAVTHCYERPPHPLLWPYNIFTMIHAHTTEECLTILKAMSEKVGIKEYDHLFSIKEYKKIRLRYFVE